MEAEQHSLNWFRARLGQFTGSCVGKLMCSGRKKDEYFGQTAMSYIYQVAATRDMNNKIVEDDVLFEDYLSITNVTTKAMEWGTEQEENARKLYAKIKKVKVTERGSVEHKDIPFFASSPDGYIEKDNDGFKGCLEIKCPNQATFFRYVAEVDDGLTLKNVNSDYFYQCQAHIMCTGADYTDFVVYNPFQRRPIHIVRIFPDQDVMDELKERIIKANEIVDDIIDNKEQRNITIN